MTINVSGHMARKSVVKDMNGNIINLIDETDGGWIIRNRQVVNPEKFLALVQKEKDKKEAALAVTQAVSNTTAPDRTMSPSKMDEMMKKIAELEAKLNEKKS